MLGSAPYIPVPTYNCLPCQGMASSADRGVAEAAAKGLGRRFPALANPSLLNDEIMVIALTLDLDHAEYLHADLHDRTPPETPP